MILGHKSHNAVHVKFGREKVYLWCANESAPENLGQVN